jgi:hypothetical protein
MLEYRSIGSLKSYRTIEVKQLKIFAITMQESISNLVCKRIKIREALANEDFQSLKL